MFLVDLLRPKTLVELGTHTGVSYCAFCQAVKQLNIENRCYAVDTWEGDTYTGSYGPGVLDELRAHHDPLYGHFSSLVQSTFDDAAGLFADASVDLLHIDGLHSYDAVKHDFDTWLPKLSPTGVVLFHDIVEKENDFGVWKLWEDLKTLYPSFEFAHDHGLGVLAVGKDSPPLLDILLDPPIPASRIQDFFFQLGNRLDQEYAVRTLMAQLADRDRIIRDLTAQTADREQALHDSEEAVQALSARERDRERTIQSLTDRAAERDRAFIRLEAEIRERNRQVEDLRFQLTSCDQQLHSANQAIQGIYASETWKIGSILEKPFLTIFPVGSAHRHLAGKVYRSVLRIKNGSKIPPPVIADAPAPGGHLASQAAAAGGSNPEDGQKAEAAPSASEIGPDLFQTWIVNNEPSRDELDRQRREFAGMPAAPLISIITPVYNISSAILRETIDSVLAQTYPRWELCLSHAGPEDGEIGAVLDEYARQDARIKVKTLEANRGIAGNSNACIDMARGDFVAFLDHDDVLAPFALFSVVRAIQDDPACDLLYSDEDKISPDGKTRFFPFFKPAFSPDYLWTNNYICHFLVLRKSVGDRVGWLRDGFEGAQDYDLLLRAVEKSRTIAHIPQILYHWRALAGSTALSIDAKEHASSAGLRALREHLDRIGLQGEAVPGPAPTSYQVVHGMRETPLVSIMIPNCDHVEDLRHCLESFLEQSTYRHFEIIIIENHSQEATTFRFYEDLLKDDRIRLLKYDDPFNFSLINNFAAAQAKGDVFLFLNNDTEAINSDWLERMLEHVVRPEVGVVGAKLYYPNDTIQHAGVIIGHGGIAGHAYYGSERSSFGHGLGLKVTRNVSAVTGACLMLRKSVFFEIGGFSPDFKLAFGDIDFCLKIKRAGYLAVWTPYAELYHHESKTRGYEDTPEKNRRFQEEIRRFQECWADELAKKDEFYNPNLTLFHSSYEINPETTPAAPRMRNGLMSGRSREGEKNV